MPAVTQLYPNFLRGVSRQVDNKKFPGQVREAINAFPDPTFGMLKRNGMRFIRTINKRSGKPFEEDELQDAAWFFIQRSLEEAYFGCVKDGFIYVWNTITGESCNVLNAGSAYLDGENPDHYHFRSIQDVTVVTNRKKEPELLPAPTDFEEGLVGTVVLKIVEYSANYDVTINGTTSRYKTRNADEFNDANATNTRLNADEVLAGIRAAILADNPGLTILQYNTSLEIISTTPFTLQCAGGVNNRALECYQDEAPTIDYLPEQSYEGRLVKIANSALDEDDYYLEYRNGVWEETRSPTVSEGFDARTMPHELVSIAPNEFVFQPIKWSKRESGDDNTNPPPSIFRYDSASDTYVSPGSPIQATFFYNNRFGLLSKDNVIMSQSNDVYNFFGASAISTAASDPIDINATSVRPVTLFEALPTAEGILLWGRREQFLMFGADSGPLTPTTTNVRSISNYECDINISPVENGTTSAFVSKVPGYSKLMTLQTQGAETPPIVLELSKVVTEWLPNEVTDLTSSPQSSFLALTSRDTRNVYLYKFFNNGEKDLFQSWTRWTTPGHVQTSIVLDDMFYFVTQQAGQYTLGVISVNEIPVGTQLDPNIIVNPLLDMYQRPTSMVYDATTGKTKMYVGYNHIEGKEAIMLLTLPMIDSRPMARTTFELLDSFEPVPMDEETDSDPGYWKPVTPGEDDDGTYFEVDGDFSMYPNNTVVGYNYNFEIELPKFYYNRNTEGTITDYTGNLTVARARVSVGKTGAVEFKIKAKGSEEWENLQPVTDADYYEADRSPVESEKLFTVPIHQRNENFIMKITSDMPFPVSLVSMMWEGMYTPRYYRRK